MTVNATPSLAPAFSLSAKRWFFCGIGGSGMLPLALILRGLGADVAGSDRAHDQQRTEDKFAWIESLGIRLYPQDGSGITSAEQILVASAAVEDGVPEVVRARDLGCERLSRADLLARLFNHSAHPIAIAGTSGKSTMTGMLGWILTQAGMDPTIMNGAVMKNFVRHDAPFASARVGQSGFFVSEIDESDGSIALYTPEIAVLGNVSLDHKSLDELRSLFGDYLSRARVGVVNLDDVEAAALLPRAPRVVTFALTSGEADIGLLPGSLVEERAGISATLVDRRAGFMCPLTLTVPGRHNMANALAAIAAAGEAGVAIGDAASALASFQGLARRFDIVGTTDSGITIIDDFAHNPDKAAATLRTLKAHPGRIIAFFQPHGYGPLRQMGAELAMVFARWLNRDDLLIVCDPVYFGGTVDRSEGSERFVSLVATAGEDAPDARYCPTRAQCGEAILAQARSGDQIVVMGARDDTLSIFARNLLADLGRHDAMPGVTVGLR